MFQQTPRKPVLSRFTLQRSRVVQGIVLSTFTLFAVTGVLATSLLQPAHTSAATSSTLNFQARLENASGSIAPDGNYDVTFHLFNSSTAVGGTSTDTGCGTDTSCLWEETYSYNSGPGATDARVRVVNGYLTVNLGSITAFGSLNWNQQMWLTMDIGGTTSSGTITWDGQMSPRIQLTAVPYAFTSGSVSTTDGSGHTGTLSFPTSLTNSTDTITLPDASGTVCLQSSSSCGFIVGSGTAFLQGGNTFSGTTAGELGTNNNGVLNFRTNNTDKLQLDTSGNLIFQQASTISAASAATGTQLAIQGGAATSGTNVGGNLLLQGGAGASTGASGSVIVKANTNDSMTAFQVQNAAGNSLLNVDTANSFISVGTAQPSSCNYTNYVNDVLATSPSAYWKLEDTSGSTAADSSGLGDTGTISATGVTLNQTPGPFACATSHPAMVFSAASSGKITTATSFNNPQTFTLIAMFKTTSYGPLISHSNALSDDRKFLVGSDGKLYFEVYNAGVHAVSSSSIVNDGNWHVGVAILNTSGMFLYLDGRLVSTNSPFAAGNYSAPWWIGGELGIWGGPDAVTNFTGTIGQAAVILSTLSSTTIQTLASDAGFYSPSYTFLGVNNTTPGYPLDVVGDVNTSTQYRIGGVVICTSSGCTPAAGSNNYIQLQGTTPGTAQTGNFNISGTGILSTLQSASGASGTTLTVQGGAATSGANTGGTLLLQGGAGASTGASGSVIVKANTNDSTSAFQVQNAAGSALLTGDTKNTRITSTGNLIVSQTGSCDYSSFASTVSGLSTTGYWKLEDSSGTTAADSSGNSDTGNISATGVALNQTPGAFVCATSHPYMQFTGASSGGITTTTAISNPQTFTLMALFKTTGSGPLISFTDNGSNHDRQIYVGSDGKLHFFMWNGSGQTLTSPSIVNDGAWHMATATLNGSGMTLYVDGVQVASNAQTGPTNYTGHWDIGFEWATSGGTDTTQYFTGSISQAVVAGSVNASTIATLAREAERYSGSSISLGINIGTPQYPLDVVGDINTSTEYRIAGVGICTSSGCTPAAGSNNYIQLQGSTPGTAQTGNFNISGTGIAGTLQASTIDSASSVALTIGNTHAASIGIGNTTSNIATTINGTALIKPTSGNDSAAVFQIQNAAATTTLLNVDSTVNKVTLNSSLVVNTSAPSPLCDYASYLSQVTGQSPTLYWKLEDTSGTTAADSSGNSDNGSISATGVTLNQTPGAFSCASSHPVMAFNGASSGYIISSSSFTNPTTFSLVALFKTSSDGDIISFSNTGSSNYDRTIYVGGNGKLYAGIYNGSVNTINSTATVNDNNWHLAVMTYSSTSGGLKLYLDGSLVASNTSLTGSNNVSDWWVVGHMPNIGWSSTLVDPYFTGSISQVAVFPSILSSTTISNLAQYSGYTTGIATGVGIGLAGSPSYLLDVGGDINTSTQYRIGGTVICTSSGCTPAAGSNNYFIQGGNTFSGTTAGELGTNNNGVLNFRTNNTDKLQLDTSGNLILQQASTINVVSAATGTQLTIQGGAATSGTNTGGTLLLQGGAGASTGASGSVIVKANTNDSTSAFQIQNAAGTATLLNADTTNLKVTVAGDIVNTFNSSPGLVQLSSTTTFATNPAWVTVQGKYAYVIEAGGTQSLEILDITKPSSPARVGTLSLNAASPSQIQVVGRYAYIAELGTSNAGVLEVVDLSNKQSPTSVATLSTGSSPGPFGVTVSGNYAYIADSNTNDMAIVNVSNPAAPKLVSTVATNTSPRKIAMQGKYAYVISCGGVTPKIQAYDISNPVAPSLAGSASLGQCAANISIEGRYAYVTGFSSDGELDVFDISNPTSIPAAVYTSAATHAYAWGNVLAGRYLFTSSTTAASPGSIGVVDVSTPTAPSLLQTYTDAGAFGNPRALFLSGRYLFMTDKTNNKLFIFDTSGFETTAATIHSLEAGTLAVDTDAGVANNLTVGNWLGVGQGGITTNGNLAVAGYATFANTTNSTSAFQIQDASGATVLVADTTNDEVGIDTSVAWNRFVVAPTAYNTGGITRTNGSNVLVGTGTTWSSAMVGDQVIFADHTVATITAFTDATHVTMSSFYGGTTDASPVGYEFHYAGLEVTGGGVVGVGTVSPTHQLQVAEDVSPTAGLTLGQEANAQFVISGATNQNKQLRLAFDTTNNIATIQATIFGTSTQLLALNPDGGNVSVGTASATYKLDVSGDINTSTTYRAGGTAGINVTCTGTQALNGITVKGGIVTAGSCATNAADLAEQYGSSQQLQPGEIVSIAAGDYRSVERSTAPGQSNLLGIVSTNPYQVMGNDQPGYPIALAGRVPTKVDLEGGVIHKGDKITSSSTPGVGMKSNGAGMVVGTALEDYTASGIGEIEVFVGLSYYDPLSTLQGTDSFTDLNVSGTATVNNLTVSGTATFTGNIIVAGHIVTTGNTPSATVLPAAGVNLLGMSDAQCMVSGDDTSGAISITTGTNNVESGSECTLIFATPFDIAPHPVITATSKEGVAVGVYVMSTPTGMTVSFTQSPLPGTTYVFNYENLQ